MMLRTCRQRVADLRRCWTGTSRQ